MWFAATINAFDALDQVHVSVLLRARPDTGEERTVNVFTRSTTVPGTGETVPEEWLRDALVALLESL